MPKNITLGLVLILFLSIPQAEANHSLADSLFEQGNKAYEEENFDKAVDYYNQIINYGLENHKVYYNLANAYFRENQLGRAIANYHRASEFAPRDEDILANLEYVKMFVVDKIKGPSPNFLIEGIDKILGFWTLNELNLIFVVSYFLLFILLILWIFSKTRKGAFNAAILILTFIFILSGISFGLKLYDVSMARRGVVIADKVDIKSGPGEDWTSQFTAHQGLELVIKGKTEGWYQVSPSNQVIGWVPEGTVEKI
jgi:tetratricopeptide (TPR) repeat protein